MSVGRTVTGPADDLIASRDANDDLPEGAPLTNMSQGRGHLVEAYRHGQCGSSSARPHTNRPAPQNG